MYSVSHKHDPVKGTHMRTESSGEKSLKRIVCPSPGVPHASEAGQLNQHVRNQSRRIVRGVQMSLKLQLIWSVEGTHKISQRRKALVYTVSECVPQVSVSLDI